jgi:predicted phage tail protein
MIRINQIDNLLDLSGRQISEIEYKPGWSVRLYVEAHGIDLTGRRLIVSGKVENNLDRVLHDGDEIMLVPATGDIFTGLIAIFKIISVIAAVATIGYSVYQAITYKKPAPASFGAALSEGGSGGIGIDENSSPTYGWDGISTLQQVGACVPVVYGEHMVGGNIINSFISTDSDKNYFNVLLSLCEGEIYGIGQININDNPIENFDGITQYERMGTNNQTIIPNFEDLNDINSVEATLTKNNPYVYTTSQDIDSFELYLRCPNGVFSQNREDGELIQWAVTYNVQIKKHTAGSYTDLGSVTITTKSRTTVRRIYRKDGLEHDTYDIKVTKTSDDSAGYNVGDLVLTSVNEIQLDDLEYPNTALLGMKLLATDQLSGGVPNITSVIFGKKVYAPAYRFLGESSVNGEPLEKYTYWDKTTSKYRLLRLPYNFYQFNGQSSVALSNTHDSLASGYSVSFFFRMPTVASCVLVWKWAGYGDWGLRDLCIGLDANMKLYADWNPGSGGGGFRTVLGDAPAADTIVHCVVTMNTGAGNFKLYQDSTLKDTDEGHATSIAEDFYLGNNVTAGTGGTPDHFVPDLTQIIDFRIYNRVISAAEVLSLYNGDEVASGLIHHYDFSDQNSYTGACIKDLVTSTYSGSITGQTESNIVTSGSWHDERALEETINGHTQWSGYETRWSGNPAWCLRDLILNTRFGLGEHITGTDLSEPGFLEAAKWCDEKVPDGAGYYEKRMTFNVVIDSQTRAADLITQLASSFRGIAFYSVGTVILKIDKQATPVQIFGMGNIIEGSFVQQWKSVKEQSNVIEVSYLDAEKNYTKQRVSVYDEESLAAGDPIRKRQILVFTTRISQALREGRYVMLVNKYIDRSCMFRAGCDAVAIQAADLISTSHDLPQWGQSGRVQAGSTDEIVKLDQPVTLLNGFTYKIKVRHNATDTIEEMTITDPAGTYTQVNVCVGSTHLPKFVTAPAAYDPYVIGKEIILTKDFRVVSLERTAQDEVQLTCIEYDEDIYDDTAVVLPVDNYSDLSKITPDVDDLTVNEKLVVLSGGQLQNVIEVWFNKPSNDGIVINKYKSANIYLSQDAGASYALKGNTQGTYFAITDGIGDLQTYRVLVAAVSEEGVEKYLGDSPYADITVQGKTTPPGDITDLAVAVESDHLKFTWTQVTDVDLSGYEIREVASMIDPWSGGTVVAANIQGGAYNLFTFTEGTKFYAIKAKDSSGNYSTSADYVSITVTAGDINRNNQAYALAAAVLNHLTACKLLLAWTTPATTENDQSGSGHDATYQNVAADDQGVLGQVWGITLNGSTKYFTVADHADFSTVGQAFCIGFVVNVVDGAAQRDIFGKYDVASGSEDREYVAFLGADEKLTFRLFDEANGGYIEITSSSALSVGRHLIIVQADGADTVTGLTMYDNGVLISDADNTSGSYTTQVAGATPVYIGASKDGAGIVNPFDDQMGVVFFERASLTASKIWQIFLASRGYLGL